MNFLVITTNDLPEAYFLASHLLENKQDVSILSVKGRTFSENMTIINRLRKNRGLIYVLDNMLLRFLRTFIIKQTIEPFPELSTSIIDDLKHRVKHRTVTSMHCDESYEFVRSIAPEYILIAGAPVIKPSLYRLASKGVINRHVGISPEYRGSECPLWCLSRRDFDMVGYTIHEVTERIDGGNILLQNHVPINKNMGFLEFVAFVSRKGSEGFLTVINAIINGDDFDSVPQKKGGEHFPPACLSTIYNACMNYKKYVSRHMETIKDVN